MHTALITRIRSGSLTEKELVNLHNNTKDKGVSDLVAAIEEQMRGQFPRMANKVYGKKQF